MTPPVAAAIWEKALKTSSDCSRLRLVDVAQVLHLLSLLFSIGCLRI
jgi:hypothetical protein